MKNTLKSSQYIKSSCFLCRSLLCFNWLLIKISNWRNTEHAWTLGIHELNAYICVHVCRAQAQMHAADFNIKLFSCDFCQLHVGNRQASQHVVQIGERILGFRKLQVWQANAFPLPFAKNDLRLPCTSPPNVCI